MTVWTTKLLGGDQTLPVSASLPDGVYSITLTSYDPTHAAGIQTEQTAERWVLEVFAGQQLVYTSPAIADLADAAQSLVQTVDHGVTLTGVTSMRARHVGSGGNSIVPMCAAFDRTGELNPPAMMEFDGTPAPTGEPARDEDDPRPCDDSATHPAGPKPELEADDPGHDDELDPDDTP